MLSKMKLGARLGLAFGTTAVLLLLTGAVGLFLMSRLQDNTRDLATNWLPSVQKLGELRANVNEARRAALRTCWKRPKLASPRRPPSLLKPWTSAFLPRSAPMRR